MNETDIYAAANRFLLDLPTFLLESYVPSSILGATCKTYKNLLLTFFYEQKAKKNFLDLLTETAKLFSAAFKKIDKNYQFKTNYSALFLKAVKTSKGTLEKNIVAEFEKSISYLEETKRRLKENEEIIKIEEQSRKGVINTLKSIFRDTFTDSLVNFSKAKADASYLNSLLNDNFYKDAYSKNFGKELIKLLNYTANASDNQFRKLDKTFAELDKKQEMPDEIVMIANDLVSLAKAFGLEQYFQGAVAQELKL